MAGCEGYERYCVTVTYTDALLKPGNMNRPAVSRATYALPMTSGGLHPGLVPELVDRCGTTIGVQAGGVHGHPDGAKALRAAVDAVAEGRDIEAAADETPELATALQK